MDRKNVGKVFETRLRDDYSGCMAKELITTIAEF
jgi:hypothetical protein